jgi:hypothetical protein
LAVVAGLAADVPKRPDGAVFAAVDAGRGGVADLSTGDRAVAAVLEEDAKLVRVLAPRGAGAFADPVLRAWGAGLLAAIERGGAAGLADAAGRAAGAGLAAAALGAAGFAGGVGAFFALLWASAWNAEVDRSARPKIAAYANRCMMWLLCQGTGLGFCPLATKEPSESS